MIRQAGLETPPPGMTERIMSRIEVVTLKKSRDFRPIIGKWGWILIGTAAFALIVLCLLDGSKGETNGNSLLDADRFFRSFQYTAKSFRLDLQIPKPLLFGMTGLLMWFSLDFLFSTMRWKRGTSKEQS